MREHEGAQFIYSYYNITGYQSSNQSFNKEENKHPKRQNNGYEGHYSELYVIIEFSPPNTYPCPLHPITPNIQPLIPPLSVQLLLSPRWYWSYDDYYNCCPPPLPPPRLRTSRSVTE